MKKSANNDKKIICLNTAYNKRNKKKREKSKGKWIRERMSTMY